MVYSKKRFVAGLKSYLSNLFLIWFAILIYKTTEFYSNFLLQRSQSILFWLAVLYSVYGFFDHIVFPSEEFSRSKGHIIISSFKKVFLDFFHFLKGLVKGDGRRASWLDAEARMSFLFVLVKIYYLPLMINFFLSNYSNLVGFFTRGVFVGAGWDLVFFNNHFYFFLISLIFLIDTLIFGFGYAFEAKFLKNKVKSVEPTFFGWFVALICYPPFNSFVGRRFNWFASDTVRLSTDLNTFLVNIVLLVLILVYLSATFALGTKASNLTNRGIVSRGPYKFVRHPAYIGKVAFWWVTIIPIISWPAVLSMSIWTVIYFFRAVTEERHLKKDPDYVEYCKKVKYRFIPRVF